MALRIYKNKSTGEEKKSLSKLDPLEWDLVISAPNQKFMVQADPQSGKSKLKDQDKVLKARSRNYARDVEIDDNIQTNLANGLKEQVQRAFMNKNGTKRRKIDDI